MNLFSEANVKGKVVEHRGSKDSFTYIKTWKLVF